MTDFTRCDVIAEYEHWIGRGWIILAASIRSDLCVELERSAEDMSQVQVPCVLGDLLQL